MLSPEQLDRLRVVLVATRNPLNIGAAARAMSNFGFPHMRVVSPYDVAFREARSAVGAATLLANAESYGGVAEAVADCALVVGTTAIHHRELHHPVQRLESGARLIREELTSNRVALLFGSEKVGLSNQDLSHCHFLLHIPAREEHASMNLGQAVAICLYELIRDASGSATANRSERAAAHDVELLTATLLDALRTSGYTTQPAEAATEQKVRRQLRRLNLNSHDAALCLGMLRQILWKLKSTG